MGVKKVFICLMLLIFLLITACGKSNTTSSIETSNDTSDSLNSSSTIQEEASSQENNIPPMDFIMPNENIRPIAVMIDNEGSRPLPQGGLNKAQLIYEIIVEGGATRLMPVFWNTSPEMIGPVRSARDYFLDYAIENNAVYIHFGGSPKAYSDIKKLKWNDIDGTKGRDGAIFWDLTKEGSKNWQDTYTNMEKLKNHITKLKYNQTSNKKLLFSYNKEEVDLTATEQANKIEINYSSDYSCGFTYDSKNKNYLRIRKDKPQMERTTNKQLTAKNIIIQKEKSTSIAGDDKGRQRLTNLGNGTGWFITNGKVISLKWSKDSREGQTKYVDDAGNPILLNQGQTWIEIVPLNGKVVIN